MEHRCSDRVAVVGTVGVYCRSVGWFTARLVNMSARGALLVLSGDSLRPRPKTLTLVFWRPK